MRRIVLFFLDCLQYPLVWMILWLLFVFGGLWLMMHGGGREWRRH
jgi:hypothetical protein